MRGRRAGTTITITTITTSITMGTITATITMTTFKPTLPERQAGRGAWDAHARAHAEDIRRRFDGRPVTTWQIVMFGLTGGLIPCPAAVTVLLLCLQLRQFTLGVALVGFFSVGLAVTMVSVGVAAAFGAGAAGRRWPGFATLARRAPHASGVLMLVIAGYMAASGWIGLAARG